MSLFVNLSSFTLLSMAPMFFCKIMNTTEAHSVIEKLFKNREHINKAIPAYPGHPVVVRLSLTISDMIPLDFFYNHIFAEVVFHQDWVDERLMYESSVPNATIVLSGINVNNIWLPDLWIENERGQTSYERFPVTQSTAHLRADGHVYYSARFSINVYCPMNYTNFPFDHQTCNILLGSYGYNTKLLNWVTNDEVGVINFREGFRVREFILDDKNGFDVEVFKRDYGLSGVFDHILIRLKLRRHIYFYIMEYYTPLALVVAASWISFWIDFQCTAARATLPVTTFLTLTSMAENIRKRDAGSLSHSTVLEIFSHVCTFYVFAALVEYAVVGVVDRMIIKKSLAKKKSEFTNKMKSNFKGSARPTPSDHCAGANSSGTVADASSIVFSMVEVGYENREAFAANRENVKRKSSCCFFAKIKDGFIERYLRERKRRYNLIDEYSKVAFPSSFIAFIIVYAAVCTSFQY